MRRLGCRWRMDYCFRKPVPGFLILCCFSLCYIKASLYKTTKPRNINARSASYSLQAKSRPYSCICKKKKKSSLIGTQPCPFVDELSMAAFLLQQWMWVVGTETVWAAKRKNYFLSDLLQKKLANHHVKAWTCIFMYRLHWFSWEQIRPWPEDFDI